jgi:hypothetical protein
LIRRFEMAGDEAVGSGGIGGTGGGPV